MHNYQISYKKFGSFFLSAVFLVIVSCTQVFATPIVGGQLYATGSDITIEVLSSDAAYTDYLLFVPPDWHYEFIASNKDTGAIINIGSYAAGTELLFKLFVSETADKFFTGAGDRNADGIAHAMVDFDSTEGIAVLGFEDLYGGGDLDFNDAVFRLSGGITDTAPVPEPSTLILLGGGLIGVAWYRKKRNKASLS